MIAQAWGARGLTLSLTLSLIATGSQAQPKVEDTMAQRLQACTPCHGQQGVATAQGYFPRIAGKPEGYLFEQLLNFKEGRRVNTTMRHLVQPLSSAYLQEIAAHFASLNLPYPPPERAQASAEAMQRGKQLVFEGDTRLRLPACVQCHGQAMTGVLPAVPGLLGLSKDYLTAQLGAWRNGLRAAREPDCMKAVSLALQESDIHAVSAYLSSQALPRNAGAVERPSPSGSALVVISSAPATTPPTDATAALPPELRCAAPRKPHP